MGIWRKNVWVTKIPRRRKKRRSVDDSIQLQNSQDFTNSSESSAIITPGDFIRALAKRGITKDSENATESSETVLTLDSKASYNDTKSSASDVNISKTGIKRETTLSQLLYFPAGGRESRDILEGNFDQLLSDDDESGIRDDHWQFRESISSEMEDVFLRGASQALTRYIERELHPAIKETLMTSMGYTVSYG